MSKTVELKHPIQANGETVSVLHLERPKVKHLKVIDEAPGDIERGARLISALAGIPPSAVDQLDAEDFMAASQAVADFFGGSLPTGAMLPAT